MSNIISLQKFKWKKKLQGDKPYRVIAVFGGTLIISGSVLYGIFLPQMPHWVALALVAVASIWVFVFTHMAVSQDKRNEDN